jgi:hypothetical protein
MTYANQLKMLVAGKGYYMFITTNIPLNKMARYLKGNIKKYAGIFINILVNLL